jgi:hypothetical protein
VILALASDANAHTWLGPDEERIETERYVLWLSPYPDPSAAVAQRLRIPPAELEQTVAEVPALVHAGGSAAFTWEVAGTAEPPDLVDRLLELGCVPDRDSHGVGMALTAPPDGGESPGVVTRRAQAPWNDAVARGTPALMPHAGAMSRPILRALGFRELTTIRVRVDASAPSGSMRP